jgi:hypothetical protein
VPWLPELFSAPVVARFEEQTRRNEVLTVPYFAGFLTGEVDALIGGAPHAPVIRGMKLAPES